VRTYRRVVPAGLVLLALCPALKSEPPATGLARIVIGKPPVFDTAARTSFRPVPDSALRAAGFVLLADYNARAVVAGPSSNSDILIATLASSGYRATLASDLDTVEIHGYSIDPDTGGITPEPADHGSALADRGMFVLVLTSYPLPEWMTAVRALGMTIAAPLPPAAFVVYGPAAAVPSLTRLPFVRTISPLTPEMKRLGGETVAGPGPANRYSVEAIEPPGGTLSSYLSDLSTEPVVENRTTPSHVTYEATLTDLDVRNVSQWQNVYGIARKAE
jgi:hypothetical protein